MIRSLRIWWRNLRLRWKLLTVVLPLVIIPVIVAGTTVGYISARQAYNGITETSMADLDHMAQFTLDLFDSHYQQFQVYRNDKRASFEADLRALHQVAYELVENASHQVRHGGIAAADARKDARASLRRINVGESGYLFVIDTAGVLQVHIAREGENILDEKDENGRLFIREMIDSAVASPDRTLVMTYPWRNAVLGDETTRNKIAAYRYFPEWGWVIAASGYLDETVNDLAFERKAMEDLKEKLKEKRVGTTGYIYAMTGEGTFTIHPEREGQNFLNAQDYAGNYFIREMCQQKNGWIRYPWQNEGDPEPRMKIVRYRSFDPWGWIIAVGSYEDEFYHHANDIKGRTFWWMLILTLPICVLAVAGVLWASRRMTKPIARMISVMREVKRGSTEATMPEGGDELGELGSAFNRMILMLRQNREIEVNLAQQEKMASLGILSSGVAHEINNPLGVILGYASYLEGKFDPESDTYRYIHDIKRESKRCKKIVQDLLSYARMPKPQKDPTDLNALLKQIAEFAANHTDLRRVTLRTEFAPDLPEVPVDGDLLRQVAINLILNAGNAIEGEGEILVRTSRDGETHVLVECIDTGSGILPEHLEQIFEPFFTTRARGTGLGLAITRQIVEMHQGSIWVTSEIGRGTKVYLRLPLRPEIF